MQPSPYYSGFSILTHWKCRILEMSCVRNGVWTEVLFRISVFYQDTDFANFIKRIGVFLIFALMLEVKSCVRGFGGDEFFEFERFAN